MKFACNPQIFRDALRAPARATTSTSTKWLDLPVVTKGLHLRLEGDQLAITGTNLDTTVITTVVVNGMSDGAAVVVPAKMFCDLISNLEGTVEINVEEDTMWIVAGKTNFSVRTYPTDEFPAIMLPPTDNSIDVNTADLFPAFSRVLVAASTDPSRPLLTGVCFQMVGGDNPSLEIACTDSYRLGVIQIADPALSPTTPVIVPASALSELVHLDTEQIAITLDARRIMFQAGDTSILATLIDGEYPNYAALIPKAETRTLTIDHAELTTAVKRVAVIAGADDPIRFTIDDDQFIIEALQDDVGTAAEDVDASTFEWEGPAGYQIAFSPSYLLAALSTLNAGDVFLEFTEPTSPVLFGDDHETALHLVMPVKLS